MPSERSARIMSQAARRAAGSKPVVGSSRNTSSGFPTSATPRSSRRFCPPESVFTRASRFSVSPTSSIDLVDVAGVRVVPGELLVRLAHGEERAELRLLEDDADALAERPRARPWIVPEHRCGTSVARPVALEDLDGCRLAGSVRAEHAEDLADRDLEADAAERLDAAVGLAEVGDDDRGRHGAETIFGSPRLGRVARVPTLRYVVVDVFTDTALTGNQLAVFTDARAVGRRPDAGAREGDRLLGDDVRPARGVGRPRAPAHLQSEPRDGRSPGTRSSARRGCSRSRSSAA